MNKQEIFDKVATALIKQGKACVNGSRCSYYNNGNRCAIGWLLSEEQAKFYEENCHGQGVYDLPELDLGPDLDFLAVLQDTHDQDSQEPDWFVNWLYNMHKIALQEDLDPSVLGNANE